MIEQSVVVIGLPGSGKTTYLAGLWHVVTAQDIPTKLKFCHLAAGSHKHLNEIAARWREAKQQDRTLLQGLKLVQMNLKDNAGRKLRVTFPDVPGEEYRRMWEEREVEPAVMETLRAKGVLFFINADEINQPNWIVDENETYARWGITVQQGQPIEWHPRAAPTQVQLVDILQILRSPPLDVGPRKIAFILSVWDKASGEGLTPELYLAQKMPLLNQYLARNVDDWSAQIFGVSAQGGEYDDVDPAKERSQEAEALRLRDNASTRIDVLTGEHRTHDLTEPLAWLME